LRELLDGIFYVVRTGCQWRALPHQYPPWPTGSWWFRRFRLDGTWDQLNAALRQQVPVVAGRHPQPSAGIIDSQSVETSGAGGLRGFDGGKEVNGRKRHILVDTLRLVLRAVVHPAAIQDRAAVPVLLAGIAAQFPRLAHAWRDQGHSGSGRQWIEQRLGWSVAIVQHPRTWERGFLGVMDPVTGALDDGSENAGLAHELARSFTVYNYARRGRGQSGDAPAYAVAREIEDLAALIAEAGGSARVHAVSSGSALALEAAAAGLPIDRLSVYEVPYFTDDQILARWRAYTLELNSALAQGEAGEALEMFHRVAVFSEDETAAARESPLWTAAVALEHTLAYDAAILGDGSVPTDRLARVRQPTLVLTGGGGLFEPAADAIAAALPNSDRRVLPGEGHVADPAVVGAVVGAFFNA
jgi:transposase